MPGPHRVAHKIRHASPDMIASVVIPEIDDALIWGCPMQELLDFVSTFAIIKGNGRRWTGDETKPMESVTYTARRLVNPSVEAMQKQSVNEQDPDRAVESVVEPGPGMVMESIVGETGRKATLA